MSKTSLYTSSRFDLWFACWLVYLALYLAFREYDSSLYAGLLALVGQVVLDLLSFYYCFLISRKIQKGFKNVFIFFSISFVFAAIADGSYNFIINIQQIIPTPSYLQTVYALPFIGFLLFQSLSWFFLVIALKENFKKLYFSFLLYISAISFVALLSIALMSSQLRISDISYLSKSYHVMDNIFEYLGLIMAISCLVISKNKAVSFIATGYLIIISSDFILRVNEFSETLVPGHILETTWVLGLLLFMIGFRHIWKTLQRELPYKWFCKWSSIRPQLNAWSFLLCLASLFICSLWILIFFRDDIINKINVVKYSPSFLILYSVCASLISNFFSKKITEPFQYLESVTNKFTTSGFHLTEDFLDNKKTQFKILEFVKFEKCLIGSLREIEKKIALEYKYNMLSSQVAHDIRSPLAALSSMTKDLSELPEEKRILLRSAIQRIDDIANDLAQKKHVPQENMGAGSQPANTVGAQLPRPGEETSPLHIRPSQDTQDVYLLSSLIEPVVSEKRFEYRERLSIEIRSNLDENSYGLFSKINSKEFKRILSNLINNAIEAFGPSTDSGQDKGQVIVSLNGVGAGSKPANVGAIHELPLPDDMIEIQIKDNGQGIPAEILPKLMERGASFGKEKQEKSGSGLGLYHAKTTLQAWGGDLKIASQYIGADPQSADTVGAGPRACPDVEGQPQGVAPTGSGTVVTILLKKEPVPKWFVPRLEIAQNTNIVAVDDDNSIHEVWNTRLHRYIKDKTIRITHLANPEALREYVGARSPRPGEETSPLHVRPSHLLFLCDYEFLGHKQNGLDIIEELNIPDKSVRDDKPSVLIDDDILIHTTWKMTGKERDIKKVIGKTPPWVEEE